MDIKGVRSVINKLIQEEVSAKRIMKLRDLIGNVPSDIADIFDVCKNEAVLLHTDKPGAADYYVVIYCNCLLQWHGLVDQGLDIIKDSRETIKKSNNVEEAIINFKHASDNKGWLASDMLRIINYLKPMTFAGDKLSDYWKPRDMMVNIIRGEFTGKSSLSKTFKQQLLRTNIEIG